VTHAGISETEYTAGEEEGDKGIPQGTPQLEEEIGKAGQRATH